MFSEIRAVDLLIILISIFMSMGVHEAVHAYVAHILGDTTAKDEGRLTLNPLKHIDVITTILLPLVMLLVGAPPIFAAKPVPLSPGNIKFDEFGVAIVGIAGPVSNLVLAGIAAMVLQLPIEGIYNLYNPILLFIQVNIAFFVFNLLPIPPLDGSRLLYAFAPDPLRELMERIESLGFPSAASYTLGNGAIPRPNFTVHRK